MCLYGLSSRNMSPTIPIGWVGGINVGHTPTRFKLQKSNFPFGPNFKSHCALETAPSPAPKLAGKSLQQLENTKKNFACLRADNNGHFKLSTLFLLFFFGKGAAVLNNIILHQYWMVLNNLERQWQQTKNSTSTKRSSSSRHVVE